MSTEKANTTKSRSSAKSQATAADVRGLTEEVIPFRAGDGMMCNLLRVTGPKPATRAPVLLVHGAGVRANIFRPPVETHLVKYLVDLGYDVWLENWRASIDLPANRWDLDRAAVFDHPAAVKTIVAYTGAPSIKAIVHCQGSTSFVMSAVAGLMPAVDTIISNAVSLHVRVPWLSEQKLNYAVPLVSAATHYLNPQWTAHAPTLTAKLLTQFVKLTHRECDSDVCKFASFTYGSGFPTLWRHENLDDLTHDWLQKEFAAVPMTFFQQMARSARRGTLRPNGLHHQLPEDFLASGVQTTARFAFIAGELNECFLPEGQKLTHAFFDARRPNYHTLRVIPGYGHLDIFIGKRAVDDVFPILEEELARQVAPLSASATRASDN